MFYLLISLVSGLLLCVVLSLLPLRLCANRWVGRITLALTSLLTVYFALTETSLRLHPALFCFCIALVWGAVFLPVWLISLLLRPSRHNPTPANGAAVPAGADAPKPAAPAGTGSAPADGSDTPQPFQSFTRPPRTRIRTARDRACPAADAPDQHHPFECFRSPGRIILAVSILITAVLAGVFIHSRLYPISAFRCPEFYEVPFGLSQKQLVAHLEERSGPAPYFDDLENAVLLFDANGQTIAGSPVDLITVSFFSRRGRLDDISFWFEAGDGDWDALLHSLMEQYGSGYRRSNSDGEVIHAFWYVQDASIHLSVLDDGVLQLSYCWDSADEWAYTFSRWKHLATSS